MKPCSKCGGTDRNPSGDCRPCQAARNAKWAALHVDREKARKAAAYQADRQKYIDRAAARVKANAEEVRAYKAGWRRANREKARGYADKWLAAHPEKRKLALRAWAIRNPDKLRIGRQNRRARVNATPGRLSHGLAQRLFKIQRGKCACCGLPLGIDFELDHVMPLARGGAHADHNIQLLRNKCNRLKSAKHPVDYMQSKGKLL